MHAETYRRIAIHRSNGSFRVDVIVDAADYEQLRRWRWVLDHGYASRQLVRGEAHFQTGRRAFMHRELLGLAFGDSRQGDHINGDRFDNRRSNLRIVTLAQNRQNQRPHRDGSSRFRGVCWDEERGKWMARVKHRHLGRFDSEEEAAEIAAYYRRVLMPYSTD